VPAEVRIEVHHEHVIREDLAEAEVAGGRAGGGRGGPVNLDLHRACSSAAGAARGRDRVYGGWDAATIEVVRIVRRTASGVSGH
jgi:hypothetical protein